MKCEKCGTDIPEESRFCLRCGEGIPGNAPLQQPSDPEFGMTSMMLIALSFMLFFFSIVPIIMGLWIGAALMDSIGVVLVIMAFLNLNASRKHEEKMAEEMEKAAERLQKAKEESMAKLKCRYCGALNERTALKCESCGATL